MEALRVIVADDDPLARRMIRSALQDAGIVVVAEARNGREAVELTQYYGPDAVLMDVVMPELDGISATRRIVAERPEQLVILLTGADEEVGLAGLQALHQGGRGTPTEVADDVHSLDAVQGPREDLQRRPAVGDDDDSGHP